MYALGGDIQRIGTDIFLCAPDTVEVDGAISDYYYNDIELNRGVIILWYLFYYYISIMGVIQFIRMHNYLYFNVMGTSIQTIEFGQF